MAKYPYEVSLISVQPFSGNAVPTKGHLWRRGIVGLDLVMLG
jgi:hypothetical protein